MQIQLQWVLTKFSRVLNTTEQKYFLSSNFYNYLELPTYFDWKSQIYHKPYSCPLRIFSRFFVICWFFKKSTFSENSFRNTIRMSNSLDPNQAQHSVEPDLVPNCLQKWSADDTRHTPSSCWMLYQLSDFPPILWCNIIIIPPANFVLYPPQTLFVGGILFSRCPSMRPSVTKSYCCIFIKPCKHVHICKTNTLDKKVRARGQFY